MTQLDDFMENPMEMDDLGVPHCGKPPYPRDTTVALWVFGAHRPGMGRIPPFGPYVMSPKSWIYEGRY